MSLQLRLLLSLLLSCIHSGDLTFLPDPAGRSFFVVAGATNRLHDAVVG
jgi:hypothetical protein